MRRYLSWIEGLTTNQNVTGSNPVRRTMRYYKSRQSFRLVALLFSGLLSAKQTCYCDCGPTTMGPSAARQLENTPQIRPAYHYKKRGVNG